MKIKRFFAPDIRSAMKMVKEELGSDAVIMSNRSVDGGVEIVAARDFDEQEIHHRLNKPPEQAEKKSVGFPAFSAKTADDKKIHVLSSERKKGGSGTLADHPVRRNMDQYLGYAEKIQLASQRGHSHKIAKKMAPAQQARPASTDQNLSGQQDTDIQPQVTAASFSIEKVMHSMRSEMRKEVNRLKEMMDTRLAEMSADRGGNIQPVRLDLLRRLTDMGFSRKLVVKLANRLDSHKSAETAFDKSLEMLEKILPLADQDILDKGGVVALVGPTGVGKTTTIAKLAAQFILRHGTRDVAMITTDNYRIGAHEQLNTYGRILDIPVKVAGNAETLQNHLHSFRHKKLVLIDTAGMSQRDMRLAEQIKTLQHDAVTIKTCLVMSAATQYRASKEIIRAFQSYQPQAAILTKLDETVSPGAALSAIIEQQLPLTFVSDGQEVPEDIHAPDAQALINLCGTGIEPETDYTNDLSLDEWVAEGYA